VQLPKAACLNPSPSYYKQFNGFTLGLAFAMGLMVLLFAFGKYVLAPYTLRDMQPEERKRRIGKFQSNVLGKALLILYVGTCPHSTAPHSSLCSPPATSVLNSFFPLPQCTPA
jgi:hypothetical protein